MSGYAVARLNEIEELNDGRAPYRPVRHHFGIEAFGINAWVGREAGDRIINEHDEAPPYSHEELYVVQSGHATFELDGERVDAPAGTLVFVRPGVKRTAFAEEAGTTLLAIGGEVGKPYELSGWELWAPFNAAFQEGRYEEVADAARAVVDGGPPYSGVLYNLACAESLAGRKADAVEHLRRAIELSERFREYAKGDSDFDPIRDEPEFKQLIEA